MFDAVDQAAVPPFFGVLRKNQSSEDILRDAQVRTPTLKCNGNSVYFLEELKYYVRDNKKPQNISEIYENVTALLLLILFLECICGLAILENDRTYLLHAIL